MKCAVSVLLAWFIFVSLGTPDELPPEVLLIANIIGGPLERSKWEQTTLPDLPGVAAFLISGEKLDIPPGFGSLWKTGAAKP